jgi:predicted CXXCH cytochrome family protein
VRTFRPLLALICLLAAAAARPSAQTPAGTPSDLFHDDVHARAGLRCESCHTGASAPYGPIDRTKIAPLCGTCHADAASMKKLNPQARTDQYAQYLVSTHGKRMATGETRVATCTDCHGSHGMRPVADPRSPVAPQNVAMTCSRCHSDHVRMSAFQHEGNPPDDWKRSVHAAALLQRGDLSAPTCSTCHGNHGISPGGAERAALVCAQCHAREADLYEKSPKKAVFDLVGGGCVTCHSNHAIAKPDDAMISLKDPALCATCHNDQMKGSDIVSTMHKELGELETGIDRAAAVLDRAARAGMLVDDGRLVLRDAQQDQILARVNIHAFADRPFSATAAKGIADAGHAEAIGNAALGELRYRRNGLGVATLLIIGFLATLWVKIRRLQPPASPEGTA